MLKQRPWHYTLLGISSALYILIAYRLNRYDTVPLMSGYSLLFIIYAWICIRAGDSDTTFWLYAAALFRALLILALPNLSDDFYRFIWDGRLLAHGHHPFAHVPAWYMQHPVEIEGIDRALFDKLNSPGYFTIYPPPMQLTFWTAVKLFPGSVPCSVVVMRLFTLAAELGNFRLMKKLLAAFGLPQKRVLLYALNPLVILELTGNLHHEAILIFFILLSLYLLRQKALWKAALAFAATVGTKLIPLVFLPALCLRLGWKKGLIFCGITGLGIVLFFAPLLSAGGIDGFSQSIGLYFSRFEFNASIASVVLLAGHLFYGYDIIGTAGWTLGLISATTILTYSFFSQRTAGSNTAHGATVDRRLLTGLTFILLIYFMFATTVHPWYITTLLALSVFTHYRFTIVWTCLIFFTYTGYTQNSFSENYWIVIIEYIVMVGWLVCEIVATNRKNAAAPERMYKA